MASHDSGNFQRQRPIGSAGNGDQHLFEFLVAAAVLQDDYVTGCLLNDRIDLGAKVEDRMMPYAMPAEYEQQLNMYAHLLRENGFKVDGLKIVAIYRDWSKMEAKRDNNYPQLGAETHDVKLWSKEDAKAFMEERVRLHQDAETSLPYCDDEERWAKKDSWALKATPNSKRARKVFYGSNSEAISWAMNPDNKIKRGFVVEHRPGANTRCENYCLVSEYCDQFKVIQGF